MLFGQKLKTLRTEHNLTQSQLAEKLNLSKANISKYEANIIEPNMETIKIVSNLFNVSIDFLFSSEKTAPKEQPLTDEQKKLASLVQGLTVSEMEKVNDYIDFVKSKRNQ